jgi:hypothetical protein
VVVAAQPEVLLEPVVLERPPAQTLQEEEE